METRTSDDSSSLEGGGFTRRKLGPRVRTEEVRGEGERVRE